MDNQTLSTALDAAKKKVIKHGPEILTALGITGWFVTTGLAVTATPKALKCIENAEYEKQEPLTKIEVVKAAYKPYIPAIATAVTSTACLIGACKVSAGRTAALATAYQLTSTALKDYSEQVVETVGEKKEKAIREKVGEKKLKENPVTNSQVIYTGRGKERCYDVSSGRYFTSTRTIIEQACTRLTRRMQGGEMYISLNEYYDEVGLPHIPIGDKIGWNADVCIEPHFSSHLDDEGVPCLVIDYLVGPTWDFTNLM